MSLQIGDMVGIQDQSIILTSLVQLILKKKPLVFPASQESFSKIGENFFNFNLYQTFYNINLNPKC